MNSKAMSLKAKIRNYAKDKNIAAQVVLQNYMFERFLERLSKSKYRDKFVIKGGMLIAAILGLDTRATMDLDATLKGLPLTEEKIIKAVKEIGNIKIDDDVFFKFLSIENIRRDDEYGGFCVSLNAIYDTIITPLSIDVSTGDIITPFAVQYEFPAIFNKNLSIKLWGYNIETVMAEKIEAILTLGIFNTRPRDYYDIYIIASTQKYKIDVFKKALLSTAEHRGTKENIVNKNIIINTIKNNNDIKNMWQKYQNKFFYAKQIQFEDILKAISNLLQKIDNN